MWNFLRQVTQIQKVRYHYHYVTNHKCQTVQLALSGGTKGGRQPGHVPRSGCAPAVGWPLGGRDSSSQLTKLSQMLGTGGCVLLQMSPLILPRQSMPPLVTAVQCQCEVTLAVAAWLSQG